MCRHSVMPGGCTLPVPDWSEEVSLYGRLRQLPDPRMRADGGTRCGLSS
jgi:hypothetical protein